MSKIGNLPVEIPEGIKVELTGLMIHVSGPKGELERKLSRLVAVEIADGVLNVKSKNAGGKQGEADLGTTRALVANMVKGVRDGWLKKLELVGTGYRAEANSGKLKLTVGYSHPVEIEAPKGISFKVEKNVVTVEGPDKEMVGQVSANIRAVKPPEPYKGKGIKYSDEVIRRKAGKAAKAGAA